MTSRLNANETLRDGQELTSNNGYFKLSVLGGGAVVFRNQTRTTMWTTPSRTGGALTLRGDGTLVMAGTDDIAFWSAPRSGNAGARLDMQDDGNLVLSNSAGAPVWATGTNISLLLPTIRYQASGGFWCNETSEKLKELCQLFPCSRLMHWPGYDTLVFEDRVDGQDIVIQLWKGFCPQLTTLAPGGFGAEVGIYRRIIGKPKPIVTPASPLAALRPLNILGQIQTLADNELWWPFPELGAQQHFKLINPATGVTFMEAGTQTGYWLTKWMDTDAYAAFRLSNPVPAQSTDYILEYTINGNKRRWPNSRGRDTDVLDQGLAQAAINLLLLNEPARRIRKGEH